MNFRTILTVITFFTLTTHFADASNRKILFIPFDTTQELIFHKDAEPFADENRNTIHCDLIQGLVAKNCVLLTSCHLLHNIILQKTIVHDIVNNDFSFEQFHTKYKRFAQFSLKSDAQKYYAYFKSVTSIIKTLKKSINFQPTLETINQHIIADKQHILNEKHAHFQIINNYILPYATEFNPDEWIIKQATPGLYLLIPKAFLHTLREENNIPNSLNLTKQDDAIFSLPASTLPTVKQENLTHASINVLRDYNEKTQTELLNFFKTCTKNKQTSNDWTVIFTGHGCSTNDAIQQEGIIAELTHDKLRSFCTILDTHFSIKRLIIATCESGGANAFTLFQDTNSQKQLTFGYDIITVGIANASQSSPIPTTFPIKNSPLFKSSVNLLTFKDSAFNALAQMQSPQAKNKDVIINTLYPYWQNNKLYAHNLILLRAKNSAKTIPLELEGITERLSNTLLEDDSIETVDITSLKSVPKAVIIEKPAIKKTLNFSTNNNFPTFISFINEIKPYHYITEIKAPQCTFDDVISAFFTINKPAFAHIWEINRLECKDGMYTLLLIGQKISENNNTFSDYILYKKNDLYYIKNAEVTSPQWNYWTPSKRKNTYNNVLNKITSPIKENRDTILKSLTVPPRPKTTDEPAAKRQRK